MLEYWVLRDGPARLEIYDLHGRIVQGWEGAAVEAGAHRQYWSMLDRSGRRVPSGIYFVRLTSGSLAETRKLVCLY